MASSIRLIFAWLFMACLLTFMAVIQIQMSHMLVTLQNRQAAAEASWAGLNPQRQSYIAKIQYCDSTDEFGYTASVYPLIQSDGSRARAWCRADVAHQFGIRRVDISDLDRQLADIPPVPVPFPMCVFLHRHSV